MEYRKIINLLDNKNDQQSNFRTKSWVVVNNDANRNYDFCRQIKFQINIYKFTLCNYSNAYILLKGTVTMDGSRPDAAAQIAEKRNYKQCTKIVCHSLAASVK